MIVYKKFLLTFALALVKSPTSRQIIFDSKLRVTRSRITRIIA